jgi:predicted nucleic acid-binding Zn ribbon protein
VCGAAIPGDQSFCDELCEYKYKSAKRRQQLIFLAFVATFLMLLIAPVLMNQRV